MKLGTSFRTELLALVAVIVVALLALGLLARHSERLLLDEAAAEQQHLAALVERALQVENRFTTQNVSWAHLLLRGGDPEQYHRYLSEFYDNERRTLAEARALLDAIGQGAGQRERASGFIEILQKRRADYRSALQSFNRSPESAVQVDRYLAAASPDPSRELGQLVDALKGERTSKLKALEERVRAREALIFVIAAAIILAAAVALLLFIDRQFGRPMEEAVHTAREVAAGRMTERLPVEHEREFHVFALAFNNMLDRLAESHGNLERKVTELEAFSYSIAHDLRAPLRAISGYSSLLREQAGANLGFEDQALLGKIVGSAERMNRLIDGILELTRVTVQKMSPVTVNLTELAESRIARLRAAEPDREIEVRIAPGLAVLGDGPLLKVVVDNLLENAWKFTHLADRPWIEFGQVGGATRVFFVRDNGVGFDPLYADKLFGLFERLHIDRGFEGEGMGLALVERAVGRHQGRVWADGEPENGATFFFSLGPEMGAAAAG